MSGPSLLQAAVDELYAAPLAEFTARRKSLAADAKKDGDRVAATAIGTLRKPTLSADTVNRLVRGAPTEVDELLQLGVDLRAAELALDAAELRRLGDRRRRLVNDLAELAFELTGQSSPSAAVRDEVTATLNAALADEEVAQRLSSGALVTQARWDGFGSTQLPELASSMPLIPPRRPDTTKQVTRTGPAEPVTPETSTPARPASPPATRSRPATTKAETAKASSPKAASAKAAAEKAAAEDTAADRATADQAAADRSAQQVASRKAAAHRAAADKAAADQAAAKQAVAQQAADAAASAAARAVEAQELVSSIDRRISELNLQLAHQRQLLANAQRALRAAENERRAAALAATRAGAPVS